MKTKIRPLQRQPLGWSSHDYRWDFEKTGWRAWWASDTQGVHPGFEAPTLADAVFRAEGLR